MRLLICWALLAAIPSILATEYEEARAKRITFIQDMIAQLSALDVEKRDEAERTLYHLPISDKRYLVAARHRTDDKEVQRRLDRLIAAFPPDLDIGELKVNPRKLYKAYMTEVMRVDKLYQTYGSILNNIEPPHLVENLEWAAVKHIESLPTKVLADIKDIPVYEVKSHRKPLPYEVSPDTYFKSAMELIIKSRAYREDMFADNEDFKARSELASFIEEKSPPNREKWKALQASYKRYLNYGWVRHQKASNLQNQVEFGFISENFKSTAVSEVLKTITEQTNINFYWAENKGIMDRLQLKVDLPLYPQLTKTILDNATRLAGLKYAITSDPIRGEFIRITVEEEK